MLLAFAPMKPAPPAAITGSTAARRSAIFSKSLATALRTFALNAVLGAAADTARKQAGNERLLLQGAARAVLVDTVRSPVRSDTTRNATVISTKPSHCSFSNSMIHSKKKAQFIFKTAPAGLRTMKASLLMLFALSLLSMHTVAFMMPSAGGQRSPIVRHKVSCVSELLCSPKCVYSKVHNYSHIYALVLSIIAQVCSAQDTGANR
jgi:hypothetical protein